MRKLLLELLPEIEKFKNGKISGDELEAITGKILILDEFDDADEELQESILLLDSWDIQEFTSEQLDKISDCIRAYL